MADPLVLGITDIETTGLDLEGDFILEVAIILTDLDFNVLSEFHMVIDLANSSPAWKRLADNKVTSEMHAKSGLTTVLKGKKYAGDRATLAEVERFAVTWLKANGVGKGTIGFAGSGIARFDMSLMAVQMPELFEYFHYRPYDITVYRNLTKFFLGDYGIDPVEASFKDGTKAHRALADAWAHLEEFKAYKHWIRRLVGMEPSGMAVEPTDDDGKTVLYDIL